MLPLYKQNLGHTVLKIQKGDSPPTPTNYHNKNNLSILLCETKPQRERCSFTHNMRRVNRLLFKQKMATEGGHSVMVNNNKLRILPKNLTEQSHLIQTSDDFRRINFYYSIVKWSQRTF